MVRPRAMQWAVLLHQQSSNTEVDRRSSEAGIIVQALARRARFVINRSRVRQPPPTERQKT